MTTFAFAEGGGALFAAWETKRQVYYTWRDRKSGKLVPAIAAPGDGKNRRFPALAVNSKGQALLAWTQGTDWGKGGHLAWCVFGKDGRPTDESGKAGPVPAWSVISAVALQDGSFRIIH